MNKRELEKAIDQELAPFGYSKKSGTWYMQSDEGIILIDLQKSNYGVQFYLNLACVPSALNSAGEIYPKEHKCPIRIRATSAFPDLREDIEGMLNLELSIPDEVRRKALHQFIVVSMLPFLKKFESINTLREAYKHGLLNAGLTSKSAQQILV